MTVAEVIALARNSEISGVSNKAMGDEKVIDFINLGLIELSKKFIIATGVEMIRTSLYTSVYQLRNTDIVQILEIFDSAGNKLEEYNITETDNWDYKLLSYNTFMINNLKPYDYEPTELQVLLDSGQVREVENIDQIEAPNRELAVVYRKISDKVRDMDDVLPVSDMFIDALLSYIGYKVNSVTASAVDENGVSRLWGRYVASCNEIIHAGYDSFAAFPSKNVAAKGFI